MRKQDFDADWFLVKSGANELQDYLLSSQTYWPLTAPSSGFSGSADVSSLTPGNLLLSLKKLHSLPLEGNDFKRLQDYSTRIDAIRSRWQVHWVKKEEQEFQARLARWQNYLHELRANPAWNEKEFPNAVRNRTILALLTQDDSISDHERQALATLDQTLKPIGSPGPFLWEPEVQTAFPSDPFWFLYFKIS